jgi:hypothetical protein
MESREIRYFGDDYSDHHQTCPVSPPHPTRRHLCATISAARPNVTINSRNLPPPTHVRKKKAASRENAVLFMDEESGTAQAVWCAYRIRSRYLLFRTLRGEVTLTQIEATGTRALLGGTIDRWNRMTWPHQKNVTEPPPKTLCVNSRALSLVAGLRFEPHLTNISLLLGLVPHFYYLEWHSTIPVGCRSWTASRETLFAPASG